MSEVGQIFVSYHQFCVAASVDERDGYLDLYTVGDGLVHLTGRGALTVLAGPHTGWVEVGVQVLARAPGPDPVEWDAVSEATLWCRDGRISVCGLMGDCPDRFRDIPVGRPGLLRVRVRARDRRPENAAAAAEAGRAERHEVLVWSVDADTGHETLRQDSQTGWDWPRKPGRAAAWALRLLVALANPDPREVNLRGRAAMAALAGVPSAAGAGTAGSTTTVRRSQAMPADTVAQVLHDPAGRFGLIVERDGEDDAFVLPVGDLAVRLIPSQPPDGSTFTALWQWEAAVTAPGVTVPDPRPSRVQLRADSDGETTRLAVVHAGVAVPQAVLLGLVWDYLLQRAADGQTGPHPWNEVFEAVQSLAPVPSQAVRRNRERIEARRWGGKPPSQRLRAVAANTIMLSNMDRQLLDALAEATPQLQRDVARWAARHACAVAGLAGIDWITTALDALDQGKPLPPPFDDADRARQRLRSDPRNPHTVITTPDGTPNCSQQAIAFPTITQATNDDPLAAAVDALAAAMYAHGPAHHDLATACRAAFPKLGQPTTGSTAEQNTHP